jgi:hypothetical protein
MYIFSCSTNRTANISVNVIFSLVRATVVAVEMQLRITHSECVCVTMQRTRAMLYCHLWPVKFYHIFPHYLINGKNFVKKLLTLILLTLRIW